MYLKLFFLIFIFFTTGIMAQQSENVTTGRERLQEWEKHKQMEKQSPFKNLPWIQIGPILNGGRIPSIVGVPGNPNIIYVGTEVGGLWKTVNAGTTWKPVFDSAPTQVLGDIEVCPNNPDLVWVGTGAANLSGKAFAGLGIFKSEDGGNSWQHMGLEESQHVMRIAIDPNNPDVVFVATMGHRFYPEDKPIGLYKTSNGGKSWTKVLSDDRYTGCSDVVFNPENSNILYATTWNKKETRGYVFKTMDGGKIWKKLSNGLPNGEKIGRIGVDVSLTNPDVVYVYLNNHNNVKSEVTSLPKDIINKKTKEKKLTLEKVKKMSDKKFLKLDSVFIAQFLAQYGIVKSFGVKEIKQMIKSGNHTTESLCSCIEKYWENNNKNKNKTPEIGGEVYKSEDGGISWNKTHADPIYLLSSFGWSFCDIKISPTNENEIYILGVTLQHSIDGGKTFGAIEGGLVHLTPNISKYLHLDQHDIWIDPLNSNRILLGNDGGPFVSYDKGSNWMHHNTIPIGMFTNISVDNEEPYNIYGGTQDDSHVYGSSDQNLAFSAGEKWKYVWLDRWSGGDGLFIMPDITDPNIVYYESQNGALRRKNLEENKNVHIRPKRDLCEPALRTDWATPIYVSPTEPNIIYYGANRLFKSIDRGDTWKAISPDLTKKAEKGKKQNDKLSSIAIDNSDQNLIYVGSNTGIIHVTRDGGSTWNLINKDLPGKRVNSIIISEHEQGAIYVVFSGGKADRNPYVYKSVDYGQTWSSIRGNLPVEKTKRIAVDPLRAGVLYIGTELGVYVSLDDGKEWFSLSNGLPAVSVEDILVHARENELVIGTYGRGIYKMDISPIQQFIPEIQKEELYLFEVKDAKLPKRRDYDNDWFFETAKYPEFVFYLKTPASVTAEIEDESGNVVKTFMIKGGKGLNRIEWDLIKNPAQYSKSAYKGGTELYPTGIYIFKLKLHDIIIEQKFNVSKCN